MLSALITFHKPDNVSPAQTASRAPGAVFKIIFIELDMSSTSYCPRLAFATRHTRIYIHQDLSRRVPKISL